MPRPVRDRPVDRAGDLVDGQLPLAPTPRAAALLHALFDGLSEDDRAWVVERIRLYTARAAANEISEGRT